VTPAWLNAALAQAPAWDGARIVALAARPLGGAASLVSAVYRVDARVEAATPDGADETRQLLVKLHAPDDAQRDEQGYAAEAYFYTALASRYSMPAPLTFLAEYDAHSRRLLIVQEFLNAGSIGTADGLLSLDDVERVLSSLATLHAAWWNAPALTQLGGVRPFGAVIQRAAGALDSRLFLERFGELVHPQLRPAYAALPDWLPRVAEGLDGDVTLVHLDCSAKNIYIPHDRNRAPLLFDWALFRSGPAALDLATLLCYSVAPAQHRRLPELTRRYHALLTERGVRSYTYAQLWSAFRLACLWRLAAPIHNAMFATAARDAHVRAIVPQLNSAVLACRALELLPTP
jgi:hypothetical protein